LQRKVGEVNPFGPTVDERPGSIRATDESVFEIRGLSQIRHLRDQVGDFLPVHNLSENGGCLDVEGRKPKADPMAKRTPGIPGPSACHEPFG
jgi:hypothetical protein